jgi:hypothetical protein
MRFSEKPVENMNDFSLEDYDFPAPFLCFTQQSTVRIRSYRISYRFEKRKIVKAV